MAVRRTEWRLGARQLGHFRPGAAPGWGPSSARARGNTDGRLLAPLRGHLVWTLLGVIVAAVVAATRFVAIGILPPSVKMKPFAHADASTEVALGRTASFGFGKPASYDGVSIRTYALADMVDSPEVTEYVARAAGLPASKIGVLGPLWVELWRSQQWDTGPKRASQIVIEKDRYQITISQETALPGGGPGPGPGPPVIDVQAQAPSTEAAARLASAVPAGLSAYVRRMQAAGRVPEQDRYTVRQVVPVSVTPARTSQLANVAVLTFLAVLVLWCGTEVAIASVVRDLRAAGAGSKVGDVADRSSDSEYAVGTR